MENIKEIVIHNYKEIFSIVTTIGSFLLLNKYGDDYNKNLKKFFKVFKKYFMALLFGIEFFIFLKLLELTIGYNISNGILWFVKYCLYRFINILVCLDHESILQGIVILGTAVISSCIVLSALVINRLKPFKTEYQKMIKNIRYEKVSNRIIITIELLIILTLVFSVSLFNSVTYILFSNGFTSEVIINLIPLLFLFYNYYKLQEVYDKVKVMNHEKKYTILLENKYKYYCTYFEENEKEMTIQYNNKKVSINKDKFIQVKTVYGADTSQANITGNNLFVKIIKLIKESSIYKYIVI